MNRRTLLWIAVALTLGCKPAPSPWEPKPVVPKDVLIQLVEAEDTRTWDAATMARLLRDSRPVVRERAALAAGRIGDEDAVPRLTELLHDGSVEVAAMAAFALGEIESIKGVPSLLEALKYSPLLETLKLSDEKAIRARAVEALGKIAATLPEKDDLRKRIGSAILDVLKEQKTAKHYHHDVVRQAITAALRAKPDGVSPVIAMYLDEAEDEDALNALTQLGARESLDQIRRLLADGGGGANAARALGAASDVSAVGLLEKTLANEMDLRVRLASIRALGSIAQVRSAAPLLKRAEELLAANPLPAGELLEIGAALGRILQNSNNESALKLLERLRHAGIKGPEIESALAKISPDRFLKDTAARGTGSEWQQVSATVAGLSEIATTKAPPGLKATAFSMIRQLADSPRTPDKAMPDVLRALQMFKPDDLADVMRSKLKATDLVVRATAADILSQLPQSKESTTALLQALPIALRDKQTNAAVSIIRALAASKDATVTTTLVQAARSENYLVRRRAIEALKGKPEAEGLRAGPVKSRNTRADYERAVARIGTSPGAVLATNKGEIILSFLPDAAPLTVDNFIRLAEAHYFDGLIFHSSDPTSVSRTGDSRGDGHGGPGYTIRCEINPIDFSEHVVAMAVSGKDTGGSQFFITQMRQPDLDGGFTVFARVLDRWDVIPKLERGDRIRSVTVEDLSVRYKDSPRL